MRQSSSLYSWVSFVAVWKVVSSLRRLPSDWFTDGLVLANFGSILLVRTTASYQLDVCGTRFYLLYYTHSQNCLV